MVYKLLFSPQADKTLSALESDKSLHGTLKAVIKTLALMEQNIRHPSLNTHEFHSLRGPNGEKIFEAYAQNNTPGAYRIFWHYGPGTKTISIIAITRHPNKRFMAS